MFLVTSLMVTAAIVTVGGTMVALVKRLTKWARSTVEKRVRQEFEEICRKLVLELHKAEREREKEDDARLTAEAALAKAEEALEALETRTELIASWHDSRCMGAGQNRPEGLGGRHETAGPGYRSS